MYNIDQSCIKYLPDFFTEIAQRVGDVGDVGDVGGRSWISKWDSGGAQLWFVLKVLPFFYPFPLLISEKILIF